MLNIYIPNIHPETPFGNILRIMTTEYNKLTEEEKQIRRKRARLFDKSIGTSEQFRLFARTAFGKKGGKK